MNIRKPSITILMQIFLGLVLLITLDAFGSHYRAGEITYEQLDGRLFKIVITTYSDPSNPSVDAATQRIDVSFGDGTTSTIQRTSRTIINTRIVQNIYVTTHLYNSDGLYKVNFSNAFRVNDIININGGRTDRFLFSISAIIRINASFSANRSPILTKPPIDEGCLLKRFYHNPSAFDPDGDSITFELVPPEGTTGYKDPDAPNGFTLGRNNGQLFWDAPQRAGIYNIAILIKEFRAGREIGSLVRDMQINIVDKCPNDPPVVQNIANGCVVVGDEITRTITANDPQIFQQVSLTGYGGPFAVPTLATFAPNPATGLGSVTTQFKWKPSCNQIRYFAWQVVFEAKDDGIAAPVAVSQNSFFVEVVGPPVANIKTQQVNDGLKLTWNNDACKLAAEYRIYRRIDSSKWNPNYCEKGIPASTGFKLIAKISTLNNPNAESYYDNDNGAGLSPLVNYCYRIVAIYPPRDAKGNIIFSEATESMASAEICAVQILTKPSLTKVSVTQTDVSLGKIILNYIKPDSLDTNVYKAPYRFVLKRSIPTTASFTSIHTTDYTSFAQIQNLSFTDSLLNTEQYQYTYQVEFFAQINGVLSLVSSSRLATSLQNMVNSTDRTNMLSWNVDVPWFNDTFYVLRKNSNNGFDQIGSTTTNSFKDVGLINGKTYCYVIRSSGYYRTLNNVFTTVNFSQEICGTPIDTVRPCAPTLVVAPPCDRAGQFGNELSWLPKEKCADDVISYKIYYKQLVKDEFKLLMMLPASQLSYVDNREELKEAITGCYYVAGVDSVGNESFPTNVTCIENCPKYTLPNVFTPNGDGKNDLFIPFPYRFIKSVSFRVFNRWGIEVFNTGDIDILWDGTDKSSGKPLPEGFYYYTCEVEESFLSGVQKRTLNGTIQIIRQ